jgi:hypothetical protein
MPNLCPTCLGRAFVYSPGGRAPKLPCPTCCKAPTVPEDIARDQDDRRRAIRSIVLGKIGYRSHPWDNSREGTFSGADEIADAVMGLFAADDPQMLREISRLALREKHDAMGVTEGTLSERMRRFAADMRGDGTDRRNGEYAIYADAIAEFAREAREVEMAAHSALDDGTEGEEEDYPDALTKAEVKQIAEDARCRFNGAGFAPNGLYVLALRESSGGDIALCHDEETACIVTEALTAYFARD